MYMYPRGVNFPRSLIKALESLKSVTIRNRSKPLVLATSIFKGVKMLKYPPANIFLLEGTRIVQR